MVEILILSIVFLAVVTFIVLRFTTVLRQILDGLSSDRRDRAAELDHAHLQAYSNAMSAMQTIYERIAEGQTQIFKDTVDMVAGPQMPASNGAPEPDLRLDNRAVWQPDDEFDYTGLGIDPTDETLPMLPIEPEGNEHRAVMIPPGQGLIG